VAIHLRGCGAPSSVSTEHVRFLTLVVALLLLAAPTATMGQACAIPAGGLVSLAGAAVRYDVADRQTGVAWGGDVGISSRQVAFRGGYRRIEFDNGVSPHVVRASLHGRLGVVDGWSHCIVAHGGASRFETDTDDGLVLAGGLGFATAYPIGRSGIVPFMEVRGLAATASGTVLDMDMAADGLSIGVEAGLAAFMGRVQLRATGSLDGFSPALGVTPYPAQAIRLELGFRI